VAYGLPQETLAKVLQHLAEAGLLIAHHVAWILQGRRNSPAEQRRTGGTREFSLSCGPGRRTIHDSLYWGSPATRHPNCHRIL